MGVPGAFIGERPSIKAQAELEGYLDHFYTLLTVPAAYDFQSLWPREQVAIRELSAFYHQRRSMTQEAMRQRLEAMQGIL